MTATCAFPGCAKPPRLDGRSRYCSPAHAVDAAAERDRQRKRGLRGGLKQAARRQRERSAAQRAAVSETRQAPLQRPVYRLPSRDPNVVIQPPRPAPLKVYRGTRRPCEFQDDINAIVDHGSPGPRLVGPAASAHGLGTSSLVAA